MANSTVHLYPNPMAHLKWSDTEKAIARKAFKAALARDLEEVIRKTKERAAKISQPTDLWDLEEFLDRSRTKIDRTYDYRYSVLPNVFGSLIHSGRLREEDLAGLREDKMNYVRSYAEFLSDRASP